MNEENSEICLERAKKRIVETTIECLNLKEKVAELENQVTKLEGTERIVIVDERDHN
ncbi:hypothetical protein [Methanobrevibacter smithii]|uniref:hypothetical protein n=1 Tax=Methanobrevibacter smithii TaxID=2173 RepID=UPI0037DBFD45